MPAALFLDNIHDDDELVTAVRAGDLAKYRLLFTRHAEEIQLHIAFRVWVPHLVSEIMHDTFVWAYRHLDEFQPGTSFPAWLKAIASNLVRAELQRFAREAQRRKNYSQHGAWLEHLAARDVDAAGPQIEALRECLGRLPPGSREHRLIQLRYHDGLTSREIAPLVSQSAGWVRVSLHRIVQQLRTCVTKKRATPRC